MACLAGSDVRSKVLNCNLETTIRSTAAAVPAPPPGRRPEAGIDARPGTGVAAAQQRPIAHKKSAVPGTALEDSILGGGGDGIRRPWRRRTTPTVDAFSLPYCIAQRNTSPSGSWIVDGGKRSCRATQLPPFTVDPTLYSKHSLTP